MELNENQIISACLAGNWADFDQLYQHYLPKIYQYIYYRVRHKQTAEDLTSLVFLKTVKNLSTFRLGESPFAAWIYRIARNALIDHMRAAKPTQDLDTIADLAAHHNVASEVNDKINLETVKTELVNLSDVQREVLTMKVWDELSHREIGAILNISEANSKVIFSRAIASLKQKIQIV